MPVSKPVSYEEAIRALREALNNIPKEGTRMSVRQRVVIDFIVDSNTASPRAMEAIVQELKDYGAVVLLKDKEIIQVNIAEPIGAHDHQSSRNAACAFCVDLAEDERSAG